MKKVLLLSLLSLAILSPFNAFGQKKDKKDKKDKKGKIEVAVQPVIQTTADTLSYALGMNIVQGLPQFLIQQEVLADTTNATGLKLDSIKTANSKNIEQFISGFKAGISANNEAKAYNSGLSVAGQISSMTKNFSKEVLGDEKDFNMDAFVSAFVSAMTDKKYLIQINDPNTLIQEKAQEAQVAKEAKAQEELKSQYTEKIAEGEKFMAENKAKEGVITRPSGLQYKILKEGTGRTPKVNEKVKVHYHGTLLDGTVFDSSVDRGEPVEFRVGQLIRGFNEALMIMPEGSKWIVYIPYDLAYGGADQGAIKPFSNLIFEIELIEVEQPASEEAK